MKIDYPTQNQISDLQALWKQAFGDEDAFIDLFFAHGFSPDRCRCITVDGKLAGALYWFDCSFRGHPMAYLYGVATGKAFRGKGICRALTENTHAHRTTCTERFCSLAAIFWLMMGMAAN